MENRYYFDRMNRVERETYTAMLAGFSALAPSIRVPYSRDGAGDVFFRLKLDNPGIFFVTGCNYRYTHGADYMELLPEYMFDKPRVREHGRALEARLEKLLRPALALGEEEKELFVHDFICENVRYDKLKKSYSHEIIGPLQNGVGVCEGMAKTVKLMCGRLGLECVIAVSRADPDRPRGYLHAWNVIKTGGTWRHVDATFDNTLTRGGGIRYDYFNLGDRQLFRDHRELLYPVPECPDCDGSYYRRAGLSLTKPEQVVSRAAQALRKKRDSFVFHWRGGYLTREKLSELARLVDAVAAKKGLAVVYGVNWPQAVVKVSFTGAAREQSRIETDCADEAQDDFGGREQCTDGR